MFERPETLLWLIPGLPLLGAVLSAIVGGFRRSLAHVPCVIGAGASCAVAALLFYSLPGDSPVLRTDGYTWFRVGPLDVTMTFAFDRLASVMLLTVTFIGFWIAVFSIGYMHGSEGYARYFALVGLFLFSMTGLVLADNFLALFAFWEGVGLCSYLLIGYWYARPSAASAARKAFLVTRLGDVGFLLGIFLLWSMSGAGQDFRSVFGQAETLARNHPSLFTVACLLVFCGAVGKSAQFPLYTWLPDAMEGPTPVSALIHAATMVTAGVYLLARCAKLFVWSPEAQLVVACVGAFTAILAAFIALAQYDLKRVLAYSTVSQLGLMFMALGCGLDSELAVIAVTAAIFHLVTHAFFKALLFLSAGSVMHAMGDVIDMRRFSGLRRVLPITHACFLIGTLALAAIPPLSGFFSKDQIQESALLASRSGAPYAGVYSVLFAVGMLTALLTAFYSFRAYFRTFWGPEKIPEEAGGHAHESPPVMTVPLVVLAIGAVCVGAAFGPTGLFEDYLNPPENAPLKVPAPGQPLPEHFTPEVREHHTNWGLVIGTTVVALAGAGLAMWLFRRNPEEGERRYAAGLRAAYEWSRNKMYVDELYQWLFVRPLQFLAWLAGKVDEGIAGLARLVASVPRGLADLMQPLQNGLVQFYALSMAMGVVVFISYLVLFAGR